MDNYTYIDCSAKGDKLICSDEKITKGNAGFIKFRARFSEDWNGLSLFLNCVIKNGDAEEEIQVANENGCFDAGSALANADYVQFGFIGRDGEGNVRATTVCDIMLEGGAYITNPGAKADGLSMVGRIASLEKGADEIRTVVREHKEDYSNPHKVTPLQIGAATNDHKHSEVSYSDEATDVDLRVRTRADALFPEAYETIIERDTLYCGNRCDFYISAFGKVDIEFYVEKDDDGGVVLFDINGIPLEGKAVSDYTSDNTYKFSGDLTESCICITLMAAKVIFKKFTVAPISAKCPGFMSPEVLEEHKRHGEGIKALDENLAAHLADNENPHKVTPEQIGASAEDHTHDLAGTPVTTNVSVKDIASTPDPWIDFTDTSVSCITSSGHATLAVHGEVDIEFDADALVEVSVDGAKVCFIDMSTMTQVGDKFYKGNVAQSIEIYIHSIGTLTFSKFELTTYKDGLMTGEQSKKLDASEVYTTEEKETVRRVGLIEDASAVKNSTTMNAQALLDSGRLIIDSNVTTIDIAAIEGGTEATLNLGCKARLTFSSPGSTTSKVYIDGRLWEDLRFEGYADVVKITDESSINMTLRATYLTEYNGGYMSAEHLKEFDKQASKVAEIEANIGDVETILDSIIAKQEAYINIAEETSEGGEEV